MTKKDDIKTQSPREYRKMVLGMAVRDISSVKCRTKGGVREILDFYMAFISAEAFRRGFATGIKKGQRKK